MVDPNTQRILRIDWQNRRNFVADWDSKCGNCFHKILKGETFFYLGSAEKICVPCYDEVLKVLDSDGD